MSSSTQIAEELAIRDSYLVPMGVDSDAIAELADGVEGLRRGPVTFVGRLAEKKGVDVLLRAAAQFSDIYLLIIGDGPEREYLETLASRLGSSRVCAL